MAAVVFLLWGMFLLIVNTARSARRLTVAGGTPVFFSAVVLLLVVWMVVKCLPSFVRACEIFYLAIGLGLVAVVLLAGIRLEPEYVMLFSTRELMGVPKATVSVVGILSVGLFSLFLAGDITVRKGDAARCIRWVVALCVSFSLILLLILGTFGAPLASSMQRPFFQMVAGLGLSGAFQRLEALLSALWMLGDISLLGLIPFSMKRLFFGFTKQEAPKWIVWALIGVGITAFFGGELLAGQEGLLQISQETLLPMGSLLAGGLILLLFFLGKWKRSRAEGGGEKKIDKNINKLGKNG